MAEQKKTWISPQIEELDIDQTLGGITRFAFESYSTLNGITIAGPQYGTLPGVATVPGR